MEGEGWNGLIHEQLNQNQQQQHPPHRCPRCNSMNTKFCYFNNYNQSQPRYFCKACRRYWTQGGTLRNVPVGGGCRRGRRARVAAAAGEAVRPPPAAAVAPAPQQLAPAPLQPLRLQPNLTSAPPNAGPSNPVPGVGESGSMVPTFAMPPLMTPYYHGPAVDDGGYLSTLLSNNMSLNMGAAGTSNFSVMPGVNIHSFSNQQQQRQIQPQQFYQMTSREMNISVMYPRESGLTQSGMPVGGSTYQPYWSQNFMNDANHTGSVSDASVQNSMNANPNGSSAAGSSLVLNQWPKMPEYDPSL